MYVNVTDYKQERVKHNEIEAAQCDLKMSLQTKDVTYFCSRIIGWIRLTIMPRS